MPRGWWRVHALLAEAAILLLVAKLLVRMVPFGRWRHLLGRIVRPHEARTEPGTVSDHDRYLGRVVERAASRLPFDLKCLPQAMALHWMLHRRGRPSSLLIGVAPGESRGRLDDLHAWVNCCGETLIGAGVGPHLPLARFEC